MAKFRHKKTLTKVNELDIEAIENPGEDDE
jgi:hypothetical protein